MTPVEVDVGPFDAHTASASDLVGCHRVMQAWWRLDKSDLTVLSYDDAVGRLRLPFAGFGEAVRRVARRRGGVVGLATVYFLEDDSSHIALTEVVVYPRVRRQGIGTAVLRAFVPELRARGRELVEGWLTIGGDGPRWADSLGFRTVRTVLMQTLEFSGADRSLWEVGVPEGYRLQRWIGAAPDDLVVSCAEVRE
jgi:mycothiol synthase